MAITISLYLRKDRPKNNDSCPVYLRITENERSSYLSTGIFVPPSKWNSNKKEVRKSHRNYKSLNSILQKKIDRARDIQSELSKYEKESAKSIKQRLKNKETGDFFDLADEYLTQLNEQGRYYARKTTKVLLNKLEHFEGSRSLPIKHIDVKYLERFEGFLKKEYGNRNTTINKNFEPLKAIIQIAVDKHMLPFNPFLNFDGAKRGKPKPKTKLSIQQIRAIENLNLGINSKLWHIRNYFMFSFYSAGIRFGDICTLKWSDIKGNRLSYQMNKNEKNFTIELNEYQKDLLDFYTENKKASDDFIFPLLNNHTDYSDPQFLRKRIASKNVIVNRGLKEIAKLVNKKVDKQQTDFQKIENISFHVARHSFAQYAVESGLSMYELMQTLRHSKIETTQQYLKGLDEGLADKAMKKVF